MRGADLLTKTIASAGLRRIFTLSGNQIMPIFDACIDLDIKLIHARHEAAVVHMADAWGRLTGEPGIALVTAGPGFANTLSALYVASVAESPMVLISGHAPLNQLGRGAFQEMPQADMASHVTKASWTSHDASMLGQDISKAMQIAKTGRPGPVHLTIPADLLEAQTQNDARIPELDAKPAIANAADLQSVLQALENAANPLILAGPAMARGVGLNAISQLQDSTGVPAIGMESPRGVNDPSLGAFSQILSNADLIVLLGKKLDFMLQFGDAPAVNKDCQFIHLDPEQEVIEHSRKLLNSRLKLSAVCDPVPTAKQLVELGKGKQLASAEWLDDVRSAVAYRPPEWSSINSPPSSGLHTVEICKAVQDFLDEDENAIYISDGGEFGQWAQACLSTRRRVINGPSGSIGSAIPFALAAREAFPESRIVTMLGDGTMGFHLSEFDTAVRNNLSFIAVVGNDATWNAEYQIQLRSYGEDRLIGCELLPTRYDEAVKALGGHGEYVESQADLKTALERAYASGKPVCINVSMQRNAAPTIRRSV